MKDGEARRGRFTFIKLSVNCFDDEKIKLIETMPDGDTLLVIWVKLLTQAGRSNANGFIMLTKKIAFTPEMLSKVFGRTEQQIRYALKTFEEMGMIETSEGRIYVSNFMKHHPEIAAREDCRQRVAQCRERIKKRKALAQGASPTECDEALRPAVVALRATGKLDGLEGKHLQRVAGEHPRAELASRYQEIVDELELIKEEIGNPMQWLLAAASRMESSRERDSIADGPSRRRLRGPEAD